MKMHEDYTMLISLVLDGEATPAEQDQLEKHLRECATCGMLWENWRAMDRLLATAPSVSAPPGLLESLLARIAVHEARQARRRWMALGAAAAFIILAILMGGWRPHSLWFGGSRLHFHLKGFGSWRHWQRLQCKSSVGWHGPGGAPPRCLVGLAGMDWRWVSAGTWFSRER